LATILFFILTTLRSACYYCTTVIIDYQNQLAKYIYKLHGGGLILAATLFL